MPTIANTGRADAAQLDEIKRNIDAAFDEYRAGHIQGGHALAILWTMAAVHAPKVIPNDDPAQLALIMRPGLDAFAKQAVREAVAPSHPREPIYLGRWHHSEGVLRCGTMRVARADFDTNPTRELQEATFDWLCEVMNASLKSSQVADRGRRSDPARPVVQQPVSTAYPPEALLPDGQPISH